MLPNCNEKNKQNFRTQEKCPFESNLIVQGGKQYIIKTRKSTSNSLTVFNGLYTLPSMMEWNMHWIMWLSSPFTHWFHICRRVCTYSGMCAGALGQQALASESRSIPETGAHIMARQAGQRVPGTCLSPSALPLPWLQQSPQHYTPLFLHGN